MEIERDLLLLYQAKPFYDTETFETPEQKEKQIKMHSIYWLDFIFLCTGGGAKII